MTVAMQTNHMELLKEEEFLGTAVIIWITSTDRLVRGMSK